MWYEKESDLNTNSFFSYLSWIMCFKTGTPRAHAAPSPRRTNVGDARCVACASSFYFYFLFLFILIDSFLPGLTRSTHRMRISLNNLIACSWFSHAIATTGRALKAINRVSLAARHKNNLSFLSWAFPLQFLCNVELCYLLKIKLLFYVSGRPFLIWAGDLGSRSNLVLLHSRGLLSLVDVIASMPEQ